jgi:hypothetical protein
MPENVKEHQLHDAAGEEKVVARIGLLPPALFGDIAAGERGGRREAEGLDDKRGHAGAGERERGIVAPTCCRCRKPTSDRERDADVLVAAVGDNVEERHRGAAEKVEAGLDKGDLEEERHETLAELVGDDLGREVPRLAHEERDNQHVRDKRHRRNVEVGRIDVVARRQVALAVRPAGECAASSSCAAAAAAPGGACSPRTTS